MLRCAARAPQQNKKMGAVVEIESEGRVFVVSKKLTVKAILAREVSWVVSKDYGVFIAA